MLAVTFRKELTVQEELIFFNFFFLGGSFLMGSGQLVLNNLNYT